MHLEIIAAVDVTLRDIISNTIIKFMIMISG